MKQDKIFFLPDYDYGSKNEYYFEVLKQINNCLENGYVIVSSLYNTSDRTMEYRLRRTLLSWLMSKLSKK